MKKVILVSALAATFMMGSVYASGNNIGVVNVQRVFAHSPSVIKQKAQLKKHFSAKKAELQAAAKSLSAMMHNYKKNASVMQASAKKKLQATIMAKQSAIMSMSNRFRQGMAKAEQKAMAGFVKKTQAAAAVVAKKRHLDLIVSQSSVLYVSPSADVTKDVEAAFDRA